MHDYKKLIEMLRSRSKAIIHEDAELFDLPEETILDADANVLNDAADAIEQLVNDRNASVDALKAIEDAICIYGERKGERT